MECELKGRSVQWPQLRSDCIVWCGKEGEALNLPVNLSTYLPWEVFQVCPTRKETLGKMKDKLV